MRLEFNPRALCYNLYCDTKEESNKMKQMLEKPLLTATDAKSIDNMIYADIDSVKTMKTKLNSLYGKGVVMNNYIVIHVSNKPVVIFKQHIVAIKQDMYENAEIQLVSGFSFTTDEDYATVVKLIF